MTNPIKLDQLYSHITDLEKWRPVRQLAKEYPQFTDTQLKRLFWQRKKHPGLSTCYRQVGKRGYVCLPLFGLWLAGQLPDQQGNG